MKISIDTAQDSKDEIKKAIRLLQALVEHQASEGSRNIFDDSSPSLFDDAPTETPAEQPSTSAFADMFSGDSPAPSAPEPEEKKEDVPEVELY